MKDCIRSALLLLASVVASHSQDTGQLYTFFKQNIRLNDSEIAGIEHRKAVAKVLDSPTPSQIFVFGAVSIKAQPSAYLRLATDLDSIPHKTRGFHLITVKGSEPGLTGPKGSVVRKVAVDKTRSSLEKSLVAIKTQLEE